METNWEWLELRNVKSLFNRKVTMHPIKTGKLVLHSKNSCSETQYEKYGVDYNDRCTVRESGMTDWVSK